MLSYPATHAEKNKKTQEERTWEIHQIKERSALFRHHAHIFHGKFWHQEVLPKAWHERQKEGNNLVWDLTGGPSEQGVTRSSTSFCSLFPRAIHVRRCCCYCYCKPWPRRPALLTCAGSRHREEEQEQQRHGWSKDNVPSASAAAHEAGFLPRWVPLIMYLQNENNVDRLHYERSWWWSRKRTG